MSEIAGLGIEIAGAMRMSIQWYHNYIVEGFAKPSGAGRFAALGRVRLGDHVIAESEAFGSFAQCSDAQSGGLSWAQRHVDALISSA